jgi:triacylglycerol lipase
MGGLDARHMISHLGMAGRVAALVTICTPHRGSSYADWVLRHVGQRLRGLRLMEFFNLDIQALADLTTDNCRRFNAATPDVPGIAYLSVAASNPIRRMPPWALHSWQIIHRNEGDNDGLVSVRSATWADHLAVWPADHWQYINRRFLPPWVDPTDGDMTPYYMKVLDTLEQRGLLSNTHHPPSVPKVEVSICLRAAALKPSVSEPVADANGVGQSPR